MPEEELELMKDTVFRGRGSLRNPAPGLLENSRFHNEEDSTDKDADGNKIKPDPCQDG